MIDEQAGRQLATQLGIPITGTIGILLEAKQAGIISAVQPLVDAMVAEGKWISPTIYQQIDRLEENIDRLDHHNFPQSIGPPTLERTTDCDRLE